MCILRVFMLILQHILNRKQVVINIYGPLWSRCKSLITSTSPCRSFCSGYISGLFVPLCCLGIKLYTNGFGPHGSWSVHVCCLHLKMEFCSCARGRQLCGIIHYYWWTASIKPRLLFSRAGYASWWLSLSSVYFFLNWQQMHDTELWYRMNIYNYI